MEKATDWIKSHKPHTAAIAIAIIAVVAVVIAAATGAFSTADKPDNTAKVENKVETSEKSEADTIEKEDSGDTSASDEKKQDSADKEVDVDEALKADTSSEKSSRADTNSKSSGSNNTSIGGSSSSSSSSSKPSAPAHTHSWKDHTATKQVWVENWVTVPDYEDQRVFSHYLYVFSADGYSTTDINAVKAHSIELAKQGLSTNYSNVPQYTEQTVQVGSHEEDHGWYETQTYVDYQYYDCGATR